MQTARSLLVGGDIDQPYYIYCSGAHLYLFGLVTLTTVKDYVLSGTIVSATWTAEGDIYCATNIGVCRISLAKYITLPSTVTGYWTVIDTRFVETTITGTSGGNAVKAAAYYDDGTEGMLVCIAADNTMWHVDLTNYQPLNVITLPYGLVRWGEINGILWINGFINFTIVDPLTLELNATQLLCSADLTDSFFDAPPGFPDVSPQAYSSNPSFSIKEDCAYSVVYQQVRFSESHQVYIGTYGGQQYYDTITTYFGPTKYQMVVTKTSLTGARIWTKIFDSTVALPNDWLYYSGIINCVAVDYGVVVSLYIDNVWYLALLSRADGTQLTYEVVDEETHIKTVEDIRRVLTPIPGLALGGDNHLWGMIGSTIVRLNSITLLSEEGYSVSGSSIGGDPTGYNVFFGQ